jgi:hypothetical protein
MRTHTALAALLLTTASVLQIPASAQADTRAQLRLLVVDQTNAALPGATVTIFTLDGNPGVTVTADKKGVAVFPALATGLAEIVAKSPGLAPYIEKTTLQSGVNTQTVTLELPRFEEKVTVRATPGTHTSGS